MADGYALALQKALVTRLKSYAGTSGLVGVRVYDEPPQKAQRPFIRIGGIVVTPLRSSCGDDATVTFGIEAHSRPNSGRVEATRCAEAVVAALDGFALSVAGFTTVTMEFRTQTVGQDSDGKSYTAIIAFTTILGG
jgi:hypothetical protein